MKGTTDRKIYKGLRFGALITIIGIILSGPPIVFLVEYLTPQPPWDNVSTFIANYHNLQSLPYWFGFILLIGNLVFIVSSSKLSGLGDSLNSTLAIACVVIYGSLISLNYSIQTLAIPAMVSETNPSLETFTMANPNSISWTIEMFAYAILGVAYWLTASAHKGRTVLRVIKYLMIFNGISSILGLLIPAINPALLLQSGGIIGYIFWNILIVIIMTLVLLAYRTKNETLNRP